MSNRRRNPNGENRRPANRARQGRGASGHFVPGHDIGIATRFQPGQSGNPSGRPPKSILDRELEACLASFIKTNKRGPDGKRKRKLVAQIFARKLIDQALAGKQGMAQLIAERVGGKPTQSIDAKIEQPHMDPTWRRARIKQLQRELKLKP